MIFISYRRQDSGPVARRLAEYLALALGPDKVFIDTDQIRSGENWSKRIESALRESKLLIVLIGPQWLRLQDEFGRRRIDQKGDWVRSEIEYALHNGIPVVPVLFSGAAIPSQEALPESIYGLVAHQAYQLNEEYWKRDSDELIRRLAVYGFERLETLPQKSDLLLPPPVDTSPPLSDVELHEALSRLPGWAKVNRPGLHTGQMERVELYKAFRFRSYPDAMHFMITASRFIHMTDHHPDWQNLWISVRVWLTTWDIGHKPSFKDVRLAEYLETLYQNYKV